ncbi:hypothetical protein PO587_20565 [Streptomyces gilvifuscus]|uniref:Uncharacterized protein n=1 Tax=Streptomyces gilvifuscus TaxID=1550617 RepID=A0ABT5FWJ2_9ACTN|nr:hypothetical protein [Streptomyces gilvifuscus]MDC2956862.1 hypothetical protein [Streptomyces gilvifuscus]
MKAVLAPTGSVGACCVRGFLCTDGPHRVVITEANARFGDGFVVTKEAGDLPCLSFGPIKSLTCGPGGMILPVAVRRQPHAAGCAASASPTPLALMSPQARAPDGWSRFRRTVDIVNGPTCNLLIVFRHFVSRQPMIQDGDRDLRI